MALGALQREQPDQVSAGLPRPGDPRQQRLQIEAEFGVRATGGLRQRQQFGHRRRPKRLDPRGDVPGPDRTRIGPGGGLVAGQRRRGGVGGVHPARRERPKVAV